MRKQLTFLLILFSFSSFGQKIIELKNSPIIIEDRRFYIEDIIDARANKESIGTADVGLFNKTVDAKFSKTAKEVFIVCKVICVKGLCFFILS